MKSLLIALSILIGASLGWAENSPSTSKDTIKLLDDESTLGDRLRGFGKAASVDSREINELLVRLLDSEADGGKINDLLLLPSWHESLIILSSRFPEAGINGRPIAYRHNDAEIFKGWWAKNKDRIMYHDNIHSFVSEAALNTNQAQASASPPMSQTAGDSSSPPTPTPEAEPKTPPTPTQQPQSAASPSPAEVGRKSASSGLPMVSVAIVGTVITGIAIYILRRKSKHVNPTDQPKQANDLDAKRGGID